jgi:isocitrate/isopropylmalate dehydrogenase
MATQPSGDRGMSMERERHTAIRTIARFAAIAAKQRRRKAAPIQKQNYLLMFFQTIGNGRAQFF